MAGGGVGEAMLIGAAVGATAGGAGAAIQGGDPLKGALMGGAMGAVGGGLGGAGAGAGAGAVEGGTGGAAAGASGGAGAGTAVTPTANALAGSGAGSTTGSIFGGAGQGVTSATQLGAGISGSSTAGGFGLTAGSGTGAGFGSIAAPTGATVGSGMGAGAGSGITAANAGGGFAANSASNLGIAQGSALPAGYGASAPPATNIFGQAAGTPGYLSNTQLGMTAATTGIGGAMQAERDKYGMPPSSSTSYSGGNLNKLKYDPDKFTASTPTYAPESVYRPTYAAEGGIMKLAQGGMPVQQMSQNTLGGQGNMFPQSQQEHTNFATPTQMPTSAEVINSDYDAKTDPYTGVMMAKGGIARFANGGLGNAAMGMGLPSAGTGAGAQTMADQGIAALGQAGKKRMLTKEQMDAIGLQGMTKAGLQDVYGQMAEQNLAKGGTAGNKDMAAIDAYTSAAQGGDMASVMAKAQAGDYNAMLALNKVRKTPNENYAAGGHLGSYSDGGRMLKGPGDGMSDNIPATIAGKQPARLADGEFVVPADVVSHLGNGSTDAGAKQLYAMMNRVRKARTGNSKQGKQIKPAKFMAA